MELRETKVLVKLKEIVRSILKLSATRQAIATGRVTDFVKGSIFFKFQNCRIHTSMIIDVLPTNHSFHYEQTPACSYNTEPESTLITCGPTSLTVTLLFVCVFLEN